MEISKKGDAFVMNVTYLATDKAEDIQSMEMNVQIAVTSKDGLQITAPADATPISEILG
jgi:hypothetical protein